MSQRFESDADANESIKRALRKAFPKTKFVIPRDCARIEWDDDGPTVEQVKQVLLTSLCAEVALLRWDVPYVDWFDRPRWQVRLPERDQWIEFDRSNAARPVRRRRDAQVSD